MKRQGQRQDTKTSRIWKYRVCREVELMTDTLPQGMAPEAPEMSQQGGIEKNVCKVSDAPKQALPRRSNGFNTARRRSNNLSALGRWSNVLSRVGRWTDATPL